MADDHHGQECEEALCHSKLLTIQTCSIDGMGMKKPLGVVGIEVTTYHDISKEMENK